MELSENTGKNEHTIKLEEDKQLLFGPIYSLKPTKLEILKTYIKTNLANSFIWPSKSLIRALIFFNKKPDRRFCLCVNYWGLNNIIIKNQYLLFLIDKLLDQLGQVRRFIQLDLTNTYYQIRICESDKQKTAFQTRYKHFKYQVMPFSLSNTPAIFQRYVNKILAEKLDVFVIIYLNDILIYTEDPGQLHVEVIYQILDQLQKYSLFANLKKCYFHQDKVRFLEYVVSFKSISMEAKKIEIIKEWPESKSIRDIQVFLDFANFYQQFI